MAAARLGRSLCLAALVSFVLLQHAAARVTDGMVRIGGPRSRFEYISKFGYDRGTGIWKVRLKLKKPQRLEKAVAMEWLVFLDTNWELALAEPDPCSRRQHARTALSLSLKEDGTFNDWLGGDVSQNIRPHIWYFVLNDCDYNLPNFTFKLEWEMEMRNPNDEHFSVEMFWSTTANVINLVFFTGLMYSFYGLSKKFASSAGNLHLVIWFLLVTMVIQYIGALFHTIHLVRYRSNGAGVKPLEVISEIFMMLAQVCQTCLLILIGLGYTLLQSRIGELDLMAPMVFMVAVVHAMLVGLGKLQDDAHYKYHENEGAVGWILLAMRMLLYLWFLWAVQSTAKEGGQRIRRFMIQFGIAGTFYFLAYPFMFLIVGFAASYWQHFLMSSGIMVMQMGSNVWLCRIFLTRGEYFKVSTLSDSDLPGGAKVGMVKEE